MKLRIVVGIVILIGCLIGGYSLDNIQEGPGEPQAPQQEPWLIALNLDFENPDMASWSMGGNGYRVERDNTEAATGSQSLGFTFLREIRQRPYGFAAISLPLDNFRGKRVGLSGWLKPQDVSGYFTLWLRADAGTEPISFVTVPGSGTRGTSAWKEYSIEMDIPAETAKLSCGAVLSGEGKGWGIMSNGSCSMKRATLKLYCGLIIFISLKKDIPVTHLCLRGCT